MYRVWIPVLPLTSFAQPLHASVSSPVEWERVAELSWGLHELTPGKPPAQWLYPLSISQVSHREHYTSLGSPSKEEVLADTKKRKVITCILILLPFSEPIQKGWKIRVNKWKGLENKCLFQTISQRTPRKRQWWPPHFLSYPWGGFYP